MNGSYSPASEMADQRRIKKAILSRIAATFLLCAGISNVVHGQSAATIKIGGLLSMTGPGSSSGANWSIGAKLAIKEINDAGGVLGRKLEFVSADDQSDPTAAVSEAKRLVSREKVHAIIGPAASQLALAIAPTLNEAKVVSVSSAGAMQLTPEVAKYGFSVLPNATSQGEGLVNYVVDVKKLKTAAVLTDNGSNSKSLVEAIKKRAAEKGLRLTGFQEFDATSTDMTPQLLALRKDNPDTIIISGVAASNMGSIIKNLDEIGWNLHVTGSTTLGLQMPAVLKMTGPAVFESDRIVGQEYKAFTYCAGDPVGQSPFPRFLQKLKAFEPERFGQLAYAINAMGYDAIYVFKAGMEGARSTDGDKVTAWLEQNASSLKGVLGSMSASKSSHFLIGADSLTQVVQLHKSREDNLRRRVGC